MKAKKVTAKKVLACVILGPLLIPTAAMFLLCYPILWAVRQLNDLGFIDHWLTVVTGGKREPDPEQPAGDRASNEISGGMGGLIESARLAPPLPTAAQERAAADLRREAEAALKAEARQVARTLVVTSGKDYIGIGSYESGIAAIVQLDADGVKRRARTAESWVAYIADALYKFATRPRPERPATEKGPFSSDEALARLFHDTYERLAPSFGYETRPETRTFDPTSKNGRLMVAVAREILAALQSPARTGSSLVGVARADAVLAEPNMAWPAAPMSAPHSDVLDPSPSLAPTADAGLRGEGERPPCPPNTCYHCGATNTTLWKGRCNAGCPDEGAEDGLPDKYQKPALGPAPTPTTPKN